MQIKVSRPELAATHSQTPCLQPPSRNTMHVTLQHEDVSFKPLCESRFSAKLVVLSTHCFEGIAGKCRGAAVYACHEPALQCPTSDCHPALQRVAITHCNPAYIHMLSLIRHILGPRSALGRSKASSQSTFQKFVPFYCWQPHVLGSALNRSPLPKSLLHVSYKPCRAAVLVLNAGA